VVTSVIFVLAILLQHFVGWIQAGQSLSLVRPHLSMRGVRPSLKGFSGNGSSLSTTVPQ